MNTYKIKKIDNGKKFRQVLHELKSDKFVDPRKTRLPATSSYNKSKVGIIYENLWGMFRVPKNHKEQDLSVTDFAWTEEVKKEFYNHPFHKRIYNKYIKGNGMWVLNSEPSDYLL